MNTTPDDDPPRLERNTNLDALGDPFGPIIGLVLTAVGFFLAGFGTAWWWLHS